MACNTIKKLSKNIWNSLGKSNSTGIVYSEPTISECTLNRLAWRGVPSLTVRIYNQAKEAKNGADFLFLFKRVGSVKPKLALIIQAKKLTYHVSPRRYKKLFYKQSNGHLQHNLLIKYAATKNFVPLYCFYNWSNNNTEDFAIPCKDDDGREENYGWTVAPAQAVSKLHRKNLRRPTKKYPVKRKGHRSWCDFEDIAPYAIPMHCLFCSTGDLINGVFKRIPRVKTRVGKVATDNDNAFNPKLPEEIVELINQNQNKYFDSSVCNVKNIIVFETRD